MFVFICLIIIDLVVMETDWLSRLEKKLEKSSRATIDTEESSGLLHVMYFFLSFFLLFKLKNDINFFFQIIVS